MSTTPTPREVLTADKVIDKIFEAVDCDVCDGEGDIGPEPCPYCCETGKQLPDLTTLKARLQAELTKIRGERDKLRAVVELVVKDAEGAVNPSLRTMYYDELKAALLSTRPKPNDNG